MSVSVGLMGSHVSVSTSHGEPYQWVSWVAMSVSVGLMGGHVSVGRSPG